MERLQPKDEKSSKDVLLVLLLAIGWLVFVQVFFYSLQRLSTENLKSSIHGIFKAQNTPIDFAYLSRTFSDLEQLGLIQCVRVERISDPRATILDLEFRGDCTTSSLWLSGLKVSMETSSLSGESWQVTFVSTNQRLFYLSLWVFRISGVAGFVLLFLFLRSRARHRLNLYALEVRHEVQLAELARRVSHDIRSPLGALKVLSSRTKFEEREKRLLLTVSSRIEGIAESLLAESRSSSVRKNLIQERTEKPSNRHMIVGIRFEALVRALEDLVLEKKESQGTKKRVSVSLTVSTVDKGLLDAELSELIRICSNVIDNSFEAIDDQGFISVDVESGSKNSIWITIRDNGTGIPDEVLAALGKKEISFGKTNGNGIGIYQAAKTLRSWGGDLEVNSTPNLGTTVTIKVTMQDTLR